MNLGMANYLAKRFLDQVLYHITRTVWFIRNKNDPRLRQGSFRSASPEPGYFYACFLLFFGSSFRKSR